MKGIEKLEGLNIPKEFFECSADLWKEADSMSYGTVKLVLQKSPDTYHFGLEKNKSYPPVKHGTKKEK